MVSTRRKAEFRWGFGLFAVLLVVGGLVVFFEFPGTTESADAGWAVALGFLLVGLFFYVLYPSQRSGISESSRKRKR